MSYGTFMTLLSCNYTDMSLLALLYMLLTNITLIKLILAHTLVSKGQKFEALLEKSTAHTGIY